MSESTVWSCGGGTQSAAIAALIVLGDLPRPDLAVIADTGREASETWRYYEAVLKPQLSAVGVTLLRLPHSFDGSGWNTVDLYGGADGRTALIPAYTTHVPGALKQTGKFCSNEWKTRPIERYRRSLGLTGGKVWIGFSIDEIHRMRSFNAAQPWNPEYPLVDRKMTRGDCISIVQRLGWPTPPRSSCWMCPYRTRAEWIHLKSADPQDFEKAVQFDHELRQVDPSLFLHRSGQALDEVDFLVAQTDLFNSSCDSGNCFT